MTKYLKVICPKFEVRMIRFSHMDPETELPEHYWVRIYESSIPPSITRIDAGTVIHNMSSEIATFRTNILIQKGKCIPFFQI